MPAWTEERRRQQAEAIKRWKPWEKSTGPKTEAGKACASMNAQKPESPIKIVRRLLRLQREFMKDFDLYSAECKDYGKKTNY